MALTRAHELNIPEESAPRVVAACAAAIASCTTHATVFESVEDFYESYARQALADLVATSDDVATAMAETNASFQNDAKIDEEYHYCPNVEPTVARNVLI